MKTINPKKVSMALALAVSSLFVTIAHAASSQGCNLNLKANSSYAAVTCGTIFVPAGKQISVRFVATGNPTNTEATNGPVSADFKIVGNYGGGTYLYRSFAVQYGGIDYFATLPAQSYDRYVHAETGGQAPAGGGLGMNYYVR